MCIIQHEQLGTIECVLTVCCYIMIIKDLEQKVKDKISLALGEATNAANESFEYFGPVLLCLVFTFIPIHNQTYLSCHDVCFTVLKYMY